MDEKANMKNSIQAEVAPTSTQDTGASASELTALNPESLSWVAGGPSGTIVVQG